MAVTCRWSTLLSTGPTSAVQTLHQTSADPHCPHGGQTPGQTLQTMLLFYVKYVILNLLSAIKLIFWACSCKTLPFYHKVITFQVSKHLPLFPSPSTNHCPLSPQGPLGVWRSGHGRKASRKSLSSDLSVGEAGNRKSRGRLELSEPRVNSGFLRASDRNLTFPRQREAPNLFCSEAISTCEGILKTSGFWCRS